MSDSEDGDFASADEGDSPTKSEAKTSKEKKSSKKPQDVKKVESSSTHKDGEDGADKGKGKPAAGRGKGKQHSQQQQKKKGKGEGQQQLSTKKKEPEKAAAEQTSSSSTKPKDPEEVSPDLKSSKPKEPEKKSSDAVTESITTTQPTRGSPIKSTDTVTADAKSDPESDAAKESKEKTGGNEGPSKSENPSALIEPENQTQAVGGVEEKKSSGWGWSSWGSSILSVASSSVQTFTDQVGGGLSTIMDTVESSLGAPDPEEMAKSDKVYEEESPKEEKKAPKAPKAPDGDTSGDQGDQGGEEPKDTKTQPEGGGGWFSSWGVADIAKKVQNTGKSLASKGQTLVTEGFDAMENLASGGIDVLENIGKKTYSTLSEHDPAFKKTRDYLRARNNKPNLSSVLKEAKEQAEQDAIQEKEKEEAMKGHFETQFDEYQGIAHLEALEMLSNQSEKKVHSLLNSLSSKDLKEIKPILISIKEVFEVEDQEEAEDASKEQDFSSLVSQHLSELELGTAPDKLNKVHEMVKQWLVDFDSHDSHNKESPKVIHQQAIQSLAELTSKGVEQFHKAGEMVLMKGDCDKDFKERGHSFARLTGVLCHEVGNIATKFTDCLNKTGSEQDEGDVTSLVTNVYLEATNSSTYIQDAFQLLLPILQHAAIENSILSRQL